MTQLALLDTDPLGTAVDHLVAHLPKKDAARRSAVPTDVTSFLASFLDLSGAMHVDAALDARPPRVLRTPAADDAARIEQRLASMHDGLATHFARAMHPTRGLFTAARLHAALSQPGLFRTDGKAALREAAAVAEPANAHLRAGLGTLNAGLAGVRTDMYAAFGSSSAEARALVDLDEALSGALRAGTRALQDRAVAAYGRSFAAWLDDGLRGAPITLETCTAAIATGGFWHAFLELGARIATGFFALERRRMLAVIDATNPTFALDAAAENPPDQEPS